ncbi:glycosyltransferase family 39 protein [Sphingobacterium sp. lm-10]|uniref:ArnT family glycosyltransferase n=1 Tax=Sphingobacterium sp. lm-10 TaxID=2944904 RepID=UPI00202070AF|nr:glycosyltransferase family 39 protein [Sphingobacterium sp. lm-10]MCL7988301.1 glycosyltransferase family 39 protein [Sphingobacterium sp. lm-10]
MDRQTKLVVFFFCLIKLIIHLIADYHSGFQGDELLHIETGNHLAFGYMEFPPLIALIAFIQNLFQSQSVFVHHIFPHIATILIFIFVSKTVVALGGKWKAVFLVLLCLTPLMGRSQQLFQPVVFSQLFWVASFYFLTKYVKFPDIKYLWYLTFTVVLGFLTKYDIAFFIFGLATLLLFQQTREALIRHKFWWNVIVFILIVSPNIIWQYFNDFPVLKMFSRLYETQLDKLSPIKVLFGLIMSLNPLTLLLFVPAIIFMCHQSMKRYRVLSISILLSVLLLAFSKGKGYYFYPIVITILPFGGVFWESVILKKRKWFIYPVSSLLIISGFLLLPFSLPITSLENYLNNEYQYEKKEIEGGKYAIKEERYSQAKWKETLVELKTVYDSLPEEEQKNCLIWGKHYGQAGAIALLGGNYGLPEAFSLHGSFYLWLPDGDMPNTVIAIRYSDQKGSDFFKPYFEEVKPVRSIYNPYADEEEQVWQTIFICKSPQQNFNTLKKLFENRVFE